MKQRKPGEPPDMRTLDDPELSDEPLRIRAAGELRFVATWMLRTVANARPNAWRRFWARVLLGCRWEKIE